MKFTKPYIYFWITAIFILLVGLVNYKSDDAININIHDTYFIISTTHLTIAISILFFIIGLIYWVLGKTTLKLYPRLTQIHTFVSIGSFVAFTMGMLYFSKIKIENEFPLFDDFSNYNYFVIFVLMTFFLFQLLFIINLIISTLKKIFVY